MIVALLPRITHVCLLVIILVLGDELHTSMGAALNGPFLARRPRSVGFKRHRYNNHRNANVSEIAQCTDEVFQGKEFDVVVFGATGFLGQVSVRYLSQDHPDNPIWAFAGRNLAKLQQRLLEKIPVGPEMIVAELHDESALLELATRTRVILNYVGPYELLGSEAVVRAAMKGCASYVDVTAETHWKAHIMKTYEPIAKERGLAIVQSAGHVSLTADVLATLAAKRAAELGSAPTQVHVAWTKINGGNNGGFIRSAREALSYHGPNLDPYILVPGATEIGRVDKKVGDWRFHEDDLQMIKYPAAKLDCPVIRRSMALTFPSSPVSVKEAQTPAVKNNEGHFLTDPRMVTNPSNPAPGSGEGPPIWMLEEGSFVCHAKAYSGRFPIVHSWVRGKGDPANYATGIMASEMALGLAFKGFLGAYGGYFTPATALGGPDEIIDRLSRVKDGKFMEFSVEDVRWHMRNDTFMDGIS